MCRLAAKRTGKKRIEENTNVSFFETEIQAYIDRVTFCYSLTS